MFKYREAKYKQFRSTGSYEPDQTLGWLKSSLGCFDPQALTSLTDSCLIANCGRISFDPQALTSLTINHVNIATRQISFDPQALTSLTPVFGFIASVISFRSTGSYEPDRYTEGRRDILWMFRSTGSYEPDLCMTVIKMRVGMFRSTGSYEPDPVD